MICRKNRKSSIPAAAAVIAAVLCLLLAGSALAESRPETVPDREYWNEESGFLAQIYDTAGLFTGEETDTLMELLIQASDCCDASVITTRMNQDEIAEQDGGIEDLMTSWPSLFLIFGEKPEDLTIFWADSPENDMFASADPSECFTKAKDEYCGGSTAFISAELFFEEYLPLLRSIDGERKLDHSDSFYYFRSEKELRKILELEPEEPIRISDLRNRDLVLSEDLTVPAEREIFFGEGTITIEPGVTVTIEEEACVYFYSMEVKGTILNSGHLYHCEVEEERYLPIRITGKVVNDGWFFYGEIEGLDRVETGKYGRTYTNAEQTPVPGKPSDLAERKGLSWSLRRLYMQIRIFLLRNREIITTTIPGAATLVVILLILSVARKKKRRRAKKPSRTEPSPGSPVPSRSADLTEDQKKRISRLDEWLKSGLIDRKEYQALKERYRREENNLR